MPLKKYLEGKISYSILVEHPMTFSFDVVVVVVDVDDDKRNFQSKFKLFLYSLSTCKSSWKKSCDLISLNNVLSYPLDPGQSLKTAARISATNLKKSACHCLPVEEKLQTSPFSHLLSKVIRIVIINNIFLHDFLIILPINPPTYPMKTKSQSIPMKNTHTKRVIPMSNEWMNTYFFTRLTQFL